jgi:hypothetical protein
MLPLRIEPSTLLENILSISVQSPYALALILIRLPGNCEHIYYFSFWVRL